jgi:thioredoxin reductase
MRSIDVLIVGAGPYGLSLASALRTKGIEFRIFGDAMGSWKANMPPGMLLKSYPWASNLYSTQKGFTTQEFCARQALPYHDTMVALSREAFVAYGSEFQTKLVPNVESGTLSLLTRSREGFRAEFGNGQIVEARRVVLAVGIQPFRHCPKVLGRIASEFWSHSGEYGPLDRLIGKEVAIIGAGSSATDLAALLNRAGARVSLIARAEALAFAGPPRHRGLLERLIAPSSGIGEGWVFKACANAPQLVHLLPESWRHDLAYARALGPLGGAFMSNQVIGKVDALLGREVTGAEVSGGRVHLNLSGRGGASEVVKADHVIAATGYRIDVDRLSFLDAHIMRKLRCAAKAPVLSADYESSVPGLYFIGPTSANSFGPVTRFVFGTQHPTRRLAGHFGRKSGKFAAPSKLATLTPVVSE